MQLDIITLVYLIASVLFIIGLKMLSSPDKARKGNILAAVGMTMAIVATMTLPQVNNIGWILAGIAVGGVIGTVAAKKVKMTAMPQMVSLFNGMGGACAALIGVIEFSHLSHSETAVDLSGATVLTILLGLLIGSVSFSGSMIAMGKLQGVISDKFKGRLVGILSFATLIGSLVVLYLIMAGDTVNVPMMYLLFGVALLYGILFVLPIGGADMPVVISLLNSFTGVAAACGGFLYDNPVMLTGGILVGSAGTILTIDMCRAMNRSLANVIFGALTAKAGASGGSDGDKTVRETTITDAAIMMSYAKKVTFVPGYGLAVAQAQHVCHELDRLLEEKGVEVKYAIHPVAGRMPGHMNVLLAEADVPYDKLCEMDDINAEFPQTDVVVIIGANDVVNPAAKNDPSSPIFGMPILEVDKAHNTIVIKRSMSSGYAGIDNELFYYEKNRMLFGDAKSALQKLVAEVKNT